MNELGVKDPRWVVVRGQPRRGYARKQGGKVEEDADEMKEEVIRTIAGRATDRRATCCVLQASSFLGL